MKKWQKIWSLNEQAHVVLLNHICVMSLIQCVGTANLCEFSVVFVSLSFIAFHSFCMRAGMLRLIMFMAFDQFHNKLNLL